MWVGSTVFRRKKYIPKVKKIRSILLSDDSVDIASTLSYLCTAFFIIVKISCCYFAVDSSMARWDDWVSNMAVIVLQTCHPISRLSDAQFHNQGLSHFIYLTVLLLIVNYYKLFIIVYRPFPRYAQVGRFHPIKLLQLVPSNVKSLVQETWSL